MVFFEAVSEFYKINSFTELKLLYYDLVNNISKL